MGNSTNSTENLLPVYQYLKIFTREIKAQFHSQNKNLFTSASYTSCNLSTLDSGNKTCFNILYSRFYTAPLRA